jgi:hypothetical protein
VAFQPPQVGPQETINVLRIYSRSNQIADTDCSGATPMSTVASPAEETAVVPPVTGSAFDGVCDHKCENDRPRAPAPGAEFV